MRQGSAQPEPTPRGEQFAPSNAAMLEAFAKRDLRAIGHGWLRELWATNDAVRTASQAASLLRALYAMGEAPADRETMLEEVAVIGGVLNGIPPSDERAWAHAERLFEPGTIAEMRRWKPADGYFGNPGPGRLAALERMGLIQRDAGDVFEPLLGRDGGAGEEDMAGVIEDEDGRSGDL